MKKSSCGALLIGAGLVLAARGVAAVDASDRKVQQQVEQVLRSKISSPGGKLHLDVRPNDRSKDGYFSNIIVEGKPVQIKDLRISEFSLRASDVRISVSGLRENKIRTLQSNTSFRAVVSEDDLTQMFAKGKSTGKMGLTAKYMKDPTHGDVLRVAGNWSWSWFSGPVVGVGKLRVTANNQVFADIISLKLNGAEVPGFVKNKFSEKLNPVLDYNDVPFQPRFKTVKVEGSRATLSS